LQQEAGLSEPGKCLSMLGTQRQTVLCDSIIVSHLDQIRTNPTIMYCHMAVAYVDFCYTCT